MELLVASSIGVFAGAGVYLLLRARTFDVILGLTLISYAVNVLIFAMGRVRIGMAPIIVSDRAPSLAQYADPLPQALVLTAIVISFAMTAVLLAMAIGAHAAAGTDHVDGVEPAATRQDAADASVDSQGRPR